MADSIEKSNASNATTFQRINLSGTGANDQCNRDAQNTPSLFGDTRCLLATPFCKSTAYRNDAQTKKEKRQLIIATTLCALFMICELIGGYLAGSLAIMSDAAHLLSDCISFIVALLAIVLGKKSPDKQMTFGYKRIEVLGAILSIFGIWLLSTCLFYFAFNRLIYQDFNIDADAMMIVSAAGIVINIIMAVILHGEGLSCFNHIRSHHHTDGHSHGQKHDQSYHNNNKANFEYKPLIDDSHDKETTAKASATMPTTILCVDNGQIFDQNNDQSPKHSFAMQSINANGNMARCNSNNRQRDRAAADSYDFNVPINSNELIAARNCNSNALTICPVHHYIHRDSSEHTPIGSSDSEDIHERNTSWDFTSHHHQHASYSSHMNHTHDFSSKNINIQAAVIHVVGDFIQSIGVFISAVIIKYFPQAKIADPLCTFAFSIIVMMTTCSIMKTSIGIILEAVPSSVSLDLLTKDLQGINGVRSIHNLNIWSLTVGWNCMSVHIIIEPFIKSSDILYIATTMAQRSYNIKQCTIQIEKYHEPDSDHLLNTTLIRSHSFRAENENSINNILT